MRDSADDWRRRADRPRLIIIGVGFVTLFLAITLIVLGSSYTPTTRCECKCECPSSEMK